VELLSDAEALALVNEAYAEVWNLTDWPFAITETTITVPQGFDHVALPNDFRYVIVVRDSDDNEYRQVPFADSFHTRARTGREFKIHGTDLKVNWTVTEDLPLTFIYGKAVTDITASTSPVFPAEYHYALAYMVAAKLLAREADDSGRAEAYNTEAAGMVAAMGKQQYGPVTRPFNIGEGTARSVRMRRR
jgi:hypothetical protein